MTEAAGAHAARLRDRSRSEEAGTHEHRRSTPSRCTTRWRGSAPTSRATRTSSTGSTPATVAGLEEILERVRDMPRDAIEREHVGHPDVDGPAREVYEELISGRGLVVVRGLPGGPSTPSTRWSACSGRGCRTSASSCRTTRSGTGWCGCSRRCSPAACSRRGARSRRPSSRCTTTPPTSSRCCGSTRPSRAARASSRAARPRTTRSSPPAPTSCPILYRGFPHHRRSEQPDDQPDVTPYDVPIFSNVDGRICINFTYSSILPALHELGRELTPEEDGGDRDPPRRARAPAGRAAHAAGRRGRWRTTTPCATRAPTSSTVPTRTRRRLLLRAWTEVPIEDRRLPDRSRVLPHGERGRAPRVRPRARAGRVASRSTTTATSTRTSPTCSRPRRPSPSSTDRRPVQPRLVYFDQWTDPVAGEVLADHGGFDVTRLEITGDVDANWAALERAHGYQSLIRTELARNPGVAEQWICGPALLDRCPDLLAVCSAGAGYDIVDVDACTAAGVIVCNNSGPGREAVAEHALGFMLALAKKIVARRPHDPARASCRTAPPLREQRAARQDARHRRRRADRRPARRAVRAVRDDRARLRPVPLRRRGRGARARRRSSSTSCSNAPTSCTSTAR